VTRVLLIQPVPSTVGGVDSVLLRLIRQARRSRTDYSFTVVLPPGSPYVPVYQAEGADVETVAMSMFWKAASLRDFAHMVATFPGSFFHLRRIIHERQIDLVHSHKINVLVADFAARACGRPAVHTLHEVSTGGLLVYRVFSRIISWLTSAIVITCDASGELIGSNWQTRRDVHKIYTGIDIDELFGRRPDRLEARAGLGLAADATVVTVSARFQDTKGIEFFLDAAALVLRRFPFVTFMIVGDVAGPERQLHEYKARLLKHVDDLGIAAACRFVGIQRDLVNAYAATDIMVLPSVFDVLPVTVFEAMSMALPVVATSVGGVPEQVEDGVTGFIVPPRDGEAIADRVGRLLADPQLARRMGLAGRDRVARLFTVEEYVRATLNLYDGVLANGAAS